MRSISVHVDDDVFQEIAALAAQWDRSASWVVKDALKPYLEHKRWMIQEIEAALAEVRSGKAELIDHDEVMADLAKHAESLEP